jgi:hypothetical protein
MTSTYRKGQLSLKEFYSLTYEEKKKYIQFLLELEEDTRSDLDKYILNHFYKSSDTGPKIKFFDLSSVD